jgi:hypothetical protein
VPGYFGANFIGPAYDPFATGGDPNADGFKVNNVSLDAQLTLERLDDRTNLHKRLDRMERHIDRRGQFDTLDRFEQDAVQLVTGPRGREAFDIGKEDAKLRESYGRNSFGQSALLARRLVEHGARFVTVHSGGWDHHWDLQKGMENLLPQIDAGVAGLLTDLDQRGLLAKTLVILCGEFSRTPRMNDGSGQRQRHAGARSLGQLDVRAAGRRRHSRRAGLWLDRQQRRTPARQPGDVRQFPRDDLQVAGHQPEDSTAQPPRPPHASDRRPNANRRAVRVTR